ncbi:MAG: PQQ-like beta-propeller repeat protein [Lachnospiraceae bacterium]|nr:PQQ-like beta-propeller repeat protein [Lachnospiraceae bacterium]
MVKESHVLFLMLALLMTFGLSACSSEKAAEKDTEPEAIEAATDEEQGSGFFEGEPSPVPEQETDNTEEQTEAAQPDEAENTNNIGDIGTDAEEAAVENPAEENVSFTVQNPGWGVGYHDELVNEGLPDRLPFSLVQQDIEKKDWIDPAAWSEKSGIALPEDLPYSDEAYAYESVNDGNSFGVSLTDLAKGNKCFIDLSEFQNPSDNGGGDSGEFAQELEVFYAKALENVLYVSLAHRTYASAGPHTAFILAVDLEDGTLLWMSEEQVANAKNFVVLEDAILCGYGFTNEKDYLYALYRENGQLWRTWDVASAPEYLILDEDTLYLITYNTAYQFSIEPVE